MTGRVKTFVISTNRIRKNIEMIMKSRVVASLCFFCVFYNPIAQTVFSWDFRTLKDILEIIFDCRGARSLSG